MSMTGSFIRTVIAPIWAVKEGSPYLRHLKSLKEAKQRTMEEVQVDQLQRLKKLLVHAYENTDYYRKQFDNLQIKPDDINTLSELSMFPLLTKDDIRNQKSALVARNVSKDQLVPKKTSGSTGVSIEFFVDDESCQWKRAVTISYDRWAGWDIGETIAAVWTTKDPKSNWKSYLRNLLLERYTYLNTLTINENSILEFYKKIKKIQPTLLFGHAHSIYLLACFLRSMGLADIYPRGIISTCMVLHDFERKVIEEVFQCKVTNRYGCEEVSLIACECPIHNGMHLNYDSLIVEFIGADGSPARNGEPGAIIVTDLTNFGMPFIRYKVGDVGIPSSRTCSCGCTYPLIESVEGRTADYIVTPDGKLISGISLDEHFFFHLPTIKQMQIVQVELDSLVLRIVKGENYTEQTLNDIATLVTERFGNDMKHFVEIVDSVQQEASGKYRFCISKVKNPFTQ